MELNKLDLSDVKSFISIIEKTSTGLSSIDIAKKLGIWTPSLHAISDERPTFTKELSTLTPTQLSNTYGLWTAEFGRLMELIGVISGQEQLIKVQLKSALASARSRIRNAKPASDKTYTLSQLNDLAEEDETVLSYQQDLAIINMLLAYLSASKEATSQYISSISREIAWRDAQIKGKIY